jgi:Family of unknown function (DUF6011)
MSFSTLKAAKDFAFAGRALITLESKKSGNHHTYKIVAADDKENFFFVSHLINGSADGGTFAYLGVVNMQENAGEGHFRLTKKSTAAWDAPSVKAFQFFMASKELHPQLVIHHENHCGKCGRTLTEPESIECGIGPVCRAQMGL